MICLPHLPPTYLSIYIYVYIYFFIYLSVFIYLYLEYLEYKLEKNNKIQLTHLSNKET